MGLEKYQKIALEDFRQDEEWTRLVRRFCEKDVNQLVCPNCRSQELKFMRYDNGLTLACSECGLFRHLRGLPTWIETDEYPAGEWIRIEPPHEEIEVAI